VTSAVASGGQGAACWTSPVAGRSLDNCNYRQCRDNPPQFYVMLSHEVFAPHGRLHALRPIKAPRGRIPGIRLGADPESTRTRDEPGSDRRGDCVRIGR
jgi:hypothetical protein